MEHAMRTSQKTAGIISTIGIDLGKNTPTMAAGVTDWLWEIGDSVAVIQSLGS
jgi:hypothetical protein